MVEKVRAPGSTGLGSRQAGGGGVWPPRAGWGPGGGVRAGRVRHFLGGLGPRAHSPTQSVGAGYLTAALSARSARPAGRSRRAIGSRPTHAALAQLQRPLRGESPAPASSLYFRAALRPGSLPRPPPLSSAGGIPNWGPRTPAGTLQLLASGPGGGCQSCRGWGPSLN